MSALSSNKTFKDWTQDDLEFIFGVTRNLQRTPEMDIWINKANSIILTQEEKKALQELRDLADEDIDGWNEAELREFFISDLTKMVNFRLVKYKTNRFLERQISTQLKGIKLYGRVDWMVAKGKKKPYEPYFFIHEYKHEKGSGNDPRGQLVSMMLAAQQLNKKPPSKDLFNATPNHYYKNMPIYGIYLIGRFWFFVTLKEKQYYISDPAIVTNIDHLYFIVQMLKAQKEIIIEKVQPKNQLKVMTTS